MVLNNEYCYTTSEQSARWTDFSKAGKTERERELYDKWSMRIETAILDRYGDKFNEKEAHKLAQENARYMISSFVETSIIHKLSLRQLNYELHYMEQFINQDWLHKCSRVKRFVGMLRPYIQEFIDKMSVYRIDGLIPKSPRELAIFKDVHYPHEVFDTAYKLSYDMSIAAYAQNQRHRTIRYSIDIMDDSQSGENLFYIPPIIKEKGWEAEWLEDLESVEDLFPQGMLVSVIETGEITDFISKCYERCCGRAQLEIQQCTNINLNLLRAYGTPAVKASIAKDIGDGSAACTFLCHKCTEPCKWGAKQADRII